MFYLNNILWQINPIDSIIALFVLLKQWAVWQEMWIEFNLNSKPNN